MRRALLLLLTAGCTPLPQGHRPPPPLAACAAAGGDASSISSVVTTLNALPTPVSVACFVASLPRPLSLVATTGTISAQPAEGPKSPRIFLLGPALVLSVVPSGPGASLLEFGAWISPTRTLKAEVEFPLTAPLAPDAPVARIQPIPRGAITQCGVCHRGEVSQADGGWISEAYQPELDSEVDVVALAQEHWRCTESRDGGDATERCQLFHALFDFGEVHQGAFAPDVGRFSR